MIQRLWKLGIDWDDIVPDDVEEYWTAFKSQLRNLEQLQINRWQHTRSQIESIKLHGFCLTSCIRRSFLCASRAFGWRSRHDHHFGKNSCCLRRNHHNSEIGIERCTGDIIIAGINSFIIGLGPRPVRALGRLNHLTELAE